MNAERPTDRDELLNRAYGVEHAEFVTPSAAESAKPPEECPECGSPDVRPVRKRAAFGLFLLLVTGLGLALDEMMPAFLAALTGAIGFLIAPRWRCTACGNRWSS
ncbi:MAG TPA: hypothetical protein VKH35_10690 [Thermoanaerobaculia bacterium]|nr:hypothetical protein [Thermoanaerobaculia bacterium]